MFSVAKLGRGSAVIGAAAAMATAFMVAPATADSYTHWATGKDGVSKAGVSPKGYYVEICDGKPDGRQAFGEFHLANGKNVELGDDTGADGQCTKTQYDSPVRWFHVYITGLGAGPTTRL